MIRIQKIREIRSSQFIADCSRVRNKINQLNQKYPKHCTYLIFLPVLLLSCYLFWGLFVITFRFCSYKLEFCHERLSVSQKGEDKIISQANVIFSLGLVPLSCVIVSEAISCGCCSGVTPLLGDWHPPYSAKRQTIEQQHHNHRPGNGRPRPLLTL